MEVGGHTISEWQPYFYRLGAMFMLLYVVIGGNYKAKDVFGGAAAIALAYYTARLSSYSALLWMTIAVVCAKGVDFDRIVLVFVGVNVSLILFVALLSSQGAIKERTIARADGAIRHSLGNTHPNTLGARIFFTALGVSYLRRNNMGILDAVLMFAVAYFCWEVPNSRTSALCLGLVAAVELLYVAARRYKWGSDRLRCVYFVVAALVPALCCVLSIWASAVYDPANATLAKINMLTSARLYYGHIPFVIYPITLFGQEVVLSPAVGPAGRLILDNWYVHTLFQYGVVPLVAGVVAMTAIDFRAYKDRIYWLPFLVAVIAVYGMSEAYLFYIRYNVFLVALLAQLVSDGREDGTETPR